MAGSFFDSNVLLYLASADRAKAQRAEDLVRGGGVVSVQVLNEIANVTRRKLGWSWDDVDGFLAALKPLLTITALDQSTHEQGLDLARRYNVSVYDAMIAAAVLQAECATLWSEDLHHGLVLDQRLRVQNPFR
jgi:predicted nucleic acid-binding protein